MPANENASGYKSGFIARTQYARERSGLTQEQMAALLGIKQDVYKQYEVRTPLPHRFVEAFCIATRVTEKWLFSGKMRREAAE